MKVGVSAGVEVEVFIGLGMKVFVSVGVSVFEERRLLHYLNNWKVGQ